MARGYVVFPLLLLFLLLPTNTLGAEAGYWTCSKGQWVSVGEPSYNRPLRDCMEKPPLPQSPQRCDALGGTWGPAGLFPKPICRMPARDAGRICGDADECDSTCLARLSQAQIDRLRQTGASLTTLGRCALAYPVFGCLAVVEESQVHGVICLD